MAIRTDGRTDGDTDRPNETKSLFAFWWIRLEEKQSQVFTVKYKNDIG